jgi:Na+-transporting NADH:ubiquinone oxidoreductase subunit NqrA
MSMQGMVLSLKVKVEDAVKEGDTVAVIEAMKMEMQSMPTSGVCQGNLCCRRGYCCSRRYNTVNRVKRAGVEVSCSKKYSLQTAVK